MVLEFFRLGKKMMMKKKKKKQQVCSTSISTSSSSSMMISAANSDDPMQHNKRKCGKLEQEMELKPMMNKMDNPSTIADLPVEFLAEVLKRLPVKYVLHCMCVQKSWNFLIKTPSFITLHTNHQNYNHDRRKYLLFNGDTPC